MARVSAGKVRSHAGSARYLALLLVLGVAAPCGSPAQVPTTLDGKDLSCRSTGRADPDQAWCLDDNGFVGTYLRLAAAGDVAVTLRAAKDGADPRPARLDLCIADQAASWPVTATGRQYRAQTQTWRLPAGTYCLRVENSSGLPADRPQAIHIRDLAIAGAAVLNAAPDALALAAADTYIEHFRQGPALLTLLAGTTPLAQAPVSVRLVRHAFNFGTAITGDHPGDPEASWLTGSSVNERNYRNFVLTNFNTVVPENAGKWAYNEHRRGEVTLESLDRLVDFAARQGLRVRMHGVLWDMSEPRWVDALQQTALHGETPAARAAAQADLRAAISRRIQYFVRDRARRYFELDLLNEAVHRPMYYQLFGTDGVAGLYNEAQAAVQAAGAVTRLMPNEFDVFQWSDAKGDPYANWYRKHVADLRRAGAAVDGIGIQYYALAGKPPREYNPHSPARIAQILHNLATAHLPLTLAEFGVQDSGDPPPQRAADILADTLRLCFGHERMTTFMLWGFWASRMWDVAPAGALLDAQWNITPAGRVWQQMTGVRDWALAGLPRWTTQATLTADAAGRVPFNGFYGDYEVISGQRRGTFTLAKGTNQYTVILK